MSPLLFLEPFDSDHQHIRRPDPETLPGYDLGFTAGRADAERQLNYLGEEVVNKLTEMSFGYSEAYQHIMSSLVPLFGAISEQILPSLSPDILHSHILNILTQAAIKDAGAPVTISVPSDEFAALSTRLPLQTQIPVTFVADPQMIDMAALISFPGSETSLNVADLIANLKSVLQAAREDCEGIESHG